MAASVKTEDSKSGHVLRPIRESDLEPIYEICEELEWMFSRNDLQAWYESFQDSYLVLEIDGQFAGCMNILHIGQRHAYVGIFIVKKEFRYKGLGKTLWKECWKRVGDRSAVLSSEDSNFDMYARKGFKPNKESPVFWIQKCHFDTKGADTTVQITDVKTEHIEEIITYDSQNTIDCSTRRKFIRTWALAPYTTSLIGTNEGKIAGFLVATHYKDNIYRVGPLQADSSGIAKRLLKELVSRVPVDTIFTTVFVRSEAYCLIDQEQEYKVYDKFYYISTADDAVANRPEKTWLVTLPCGHRF